MYFVIVCFMFLALRDFDGRRFISIVLLLLLLLTHESVRVKCMYTYRHCFLFCFVLFCFVLFCFVLFCFVFVLFCFVVVVLCAISFAKTKRVYKMGPRTNYPQYLVRAHKML